MYATSLINNVGNVMVSWNKKKLHKLVHLKTTIPVLVKGTVR